MYAGESPTYARAWARLMCLHRRIAAEGSKDEYAMLQMSNMRPSQDIDVKYWLLNRV